MSESWWILKEFLIVHYDMALLQQRQSEVSRLSRYLFKMDSMDSSQSFLNHITQFKYS